MLSFVVIFYNYLVSALKRQLDYTHGLLKELKTFEKEQEVTFNMCSQKKSHAKQYKKKLLNKQQKQVVLVVLFAIILILFFVFCFCVGFVTIIINTRNSSIRRSDERTR